MPITINTWPSKDGLRIGYLNINHAINKLTDISSILFNSGRNFHVFCFAESRLSNHVSDSDVSMPGYNVMRLDPKTHKDTGLLLYFSHSVNLKRASHLEQHNTESIWIEVCLKRSKPILVGFTYRNPSERTDWFDRFTLMMDAVCLEAKEIILLGDFNINLLKPHIKWNHLYENFNLHQLIDNPTRITTNSETLIDHIYVTTKQNIAEVCSPVCGCSDHLPVCITWFKKGVKIPKAAHKEIRYRCFTHFDKDAFLLDLVHSQLSQVYQYTDPDEALEFWYKTFSSVYNKHAPFMTKRVRYTRKPPWLSKEIEEAMHQRDRLLKARKHEEFKKQRNKVTSLIRASKKTYFQNLVASKNDSRSIWKAINTLTNKDASKPQVTVKELPPDKLNSHFANVSDTIITNDQSKLNDLSFLKRFCESKISNSTLTIPPIAIYEVYNALLQLKQTGTRGLDDLDGKIIKMSAHVITETVTYIYNLCIDKNYFPKAFKQAKVIPIYKSGDNKDPSNYRPISILSLLSKPLEKHINKHLLSYLKTNELIHPNQSGFREHHSCHTALTTLVDIFYKNINKNEFTGVLFVDFAKAFDVIDHDLLLRKLTLYGLSNDTLHLISSFLSNREQLVCINTIKSDFLPVKYGIPQGSVLGPLLFSLYINDLPLFIKALCELFADDTTIHSSHSNLNNLLLSLQESINNLLQWTELNHMSLNSYKTKYMTITTRQKRQNISSRMPLYIGNEKIVEVATHKVLGVTIDNNLSWTNHVNELTKRVSQKLYQLAKIKHFLNAHARKLFFHAHIQPIIDYASTLWDSASANTLKPLVSIHKRALKLTLLKSTSLTAHDYKLLDVLPLKLKLEYNKGINMHKIVTGYSPTTLKFNFHSNQNRHLHKIIDLALD